MKNMRIIFAFTVCCAGLIALVAAFGLLDATTPYQQDSPFLAAISTPQQAQAKALTLLFVGDIMLDRGVEWEIQKAGGDWTWPFHYIADFLKEADLVFGNLESQISDKGTNVGSIYSFRANPHSIEGLVYAGFDVLSLANNHSFDYTREALEDSLLRLRQAGLTPVGAGFSYEEAHSPAVKEVRDVKIGFLAYTNSGSPNWSARENSTGIAWIDTETLDTLKEDIVKAKENVDILVVSLHAGEEYVKEPTEFQKTFGYAAIDAGVDLVIGHHAHVVQPVEQYRGGWIAYGLGNFVFDQDFSKHTMEGLMLRAVIQDKRVTNVESLRIIINKEFQPELATQ